MNHGDMPFFSSDIFDFIICVSREKCLVPEVNKNVLSIRDCIRYVSGNSVFMMVFSTV